MWAHPFVVLDVLVKHAQQMLLAEYEHVVETFPPQRSDDPLRDSVRVRRVHRRHDGEPVVGEP